MANSERQQEAARAAAHAARVSYGRLLASVATRSRDIAAAEDALADALRTALEVWPERGLPEAPEAWLLTAARRRLGHGWRHEQMRALAEPALSLLDDERRDREANPSVFPDERLKLMFICAHPAIDEAARTPLMLQTILGLDAARIAKAFLIPAATMGQRLSRAKTKIRDAGIAFALPGLIDLPERLSAVLDAVYAAYGAGWDEISGLGKNRQDLAEEAVFLARLLVTLMPDEPETRGLLALMLYCQARTPARRSASGAFIPLDNQNAELWLRDLIIEAEMHLNVAARHGVFGRFQTEAAIQSVHVQRAATGRTNHQALVALYDLLARHQPSTGALVSRAAAYGEAFGAQNGLNMLDGLPAKAVENYQPYWAVRGHLLKRTGRGPASNAAYDRAIALTDDPAIQYFLRDQKTMAPEK